MTNSLPAFAHGLFMLGMGALTAFLPAVNTQVLSLLGSPVGLTPPSLDTPGAALLGLVVMGYGVSQIHAASSNPKASAGILCSSGTVAAASAAAGYMQNQPFFYVAAVIAAIFAAWGFQDNAASKAKKSSSSKKA